MNHLRLDPPRYLHKALPSNLRCGLSDTDSMLARG
jgi:hypothetical protein